MAKPIPDHALEDGLTPEERLLDTTRAQLPEGRTRGELLLEVGVVLLLLTPMWIASVDLAIYPADPDAPPLPSEDVYRLARDVPLTALLLYLIRRGGEPWGRFGFRRPNPVIDPLFAFVFLAIDASFWIGTSSVAGALLGDRGDAEPTWIVPAVGAFAIALQVVAIIAGACFEEICCRAYLLPRLEQLLASSWKAVLIQAVLFGLWHVYQGTAGAIYGTLFGLAAGLVFCATRRIWPLMVGHAAWNLLLTYNT